MFDLVPVQKLTKDLRVAARTLSDDEARFLVQSYYTMQDNRIRSRGQERSLIKQDKPHDIITFFANQDKYLEGQVKKALDAYTESHVMGEWMREIFGIGPVLAAGLLAHIKMDRAPTVGHIWAYAGWAADNQKPWEKGSPMPFSAEFKKLLFKVGDSFIKFSNDERCFYGKIFKERREYEDPKNERLEYADQAAKKLLKVGKHTEAYKWYVQGKLPPGHMVARARRYAVKIFLSHLHQVWYEMKYNKPAPVPFAMSHLNHVHMIQPQNRIIAHLGDTETTAKKVYNTHKIETDTNTSQDVPVKKKRDRPRKDATSVVTDKQETVVKKPRVSRKAGLAVVPVDLDTPVKRKRGRPRKNPVEVSVPKKTKKSKVNTSGRVVRTVAATKPAGLKQAKKKPEVKAKSAYIRKTTKKPVSEKTSGKKNTRR